MGFSHRNDDLQTNHRDPQQVGDILGKTSLKSLLAKANLINDFNRCLNRTLSARHLTHCKAINYDNSILVIGIDSAAWATQLRFEEADLLKAFQADPDLPNVLGVKYKIIAGGF